MLLHLLVDLGAVFLLLLIIIIIIIIHHHYSFLLCVCFFVLPSVAIPYFETTQLGISIKYPSSPFGASFSPQGKPAFLLGGP